ncbi:MAG: COX15/CtaA family protein [Rhodobacteraceae bacterium]|nr:COX15/CtaA family protein [Paracoccaceae bacterium]
MSKSRKLFEEVDHRRETPVPDTGPGGTSAIRIWLAILLLLTLATILLGGLTRLTDSGLSITEWKPLTGILPPLSDIAWSTEFAKYQVIPEFRLQNSEMDLDSFKAIYWWEWTHRQLGRLVGLVWFAGFAWFACRRELRSRRLMGSTVIGGLIALQGAVGWWMVASGLTGDALDVAPYRLAIHLGLAFAITGLLLWQLQHLSRDHHVHLQARREREGTLELPSLVLMCLVFLQILAGGIVAGNDAGAAFPTWPLMNGEFFPADSFSNTPFLTNFVENLSLVTFMHRSIGYLTVLSAALAWWMSRSSARLQSKRGFTWMLGLILGQSTLGILTSLHAASTPTAILHQLGAIIVFSAAIRLRYICMYPELIRRG